MPSSFAPRPRADGPEDGGDGEGPRPSGLTAQEREVLRIESQAWKYASAKERAMRERAGLSPTDYYLLLRELVQDDRARREFPALLSRLAERMDRAASRYGLGRRAAAPQTGGARPWDETPGRTPAWDEEGQ